MLEVSKEGDISLLSRPFYELHWCSVDQAAWNDTEACDKTTVVTFEIYFKLCTDITMFEHCLNRNG